MSKVQTRRSISFTIADFEAAQALATRLGVPLAQLAGQAIRDLIARGPARKEISASRSIADRAVIADLRPDSPFRSPCKLAGCSAAPGQACRPVPRDDGSEDPELAVQAVHTNRLWQVATRSVVVPPAVASRELAGNLQADLDARVGVLPRSVAPDPFTMADARRVVAEVSTPGYRRRKPDPSAPIDALINCSSVGAGLRNIEERGLDAELEDLEQDMADHSDAGEVRVVYDEET